MSDELGGQDLRTAFTLLTRVVERLEDKVDQAIAGVQETKREVVAGTLIGEQTLTQATRTNGRVDRLEDRVDLLERRNHDGDVAREAKKEQVDHVKRAFFSVGRALESKVVTTLILLALVAAGGTAARLLPWWPW